MSKYTTGEIAKLCGVTVRTVQYYDSRNILVPSELSEGGRRLYSEDDLRRMRIICFLREAGISINGINELLTEEHPEKVISVLLDQQEQALNEELSEANKKLDMIEGIKGELKELKHFSVDSIGDIAHIMKQKDDLAKVRRTILLVGIPMEVVEGAAIVIWTVTGIWWPFAIWAAIAIPTTVALIKYYHKHIDFICPECHEVFKPGILEILFAHHTYKMRCLTCPKCGHKGFCVEAYHVD